MNMHSRARYSLLFSTALATAFLLPGEVYAQDAAADYRGLEEIVVTAQKREQSVQDVPIAVTAFTEETLQANRIYTVNDLSGLAPGLTVRPSAGGIQTPSFTMRGQVSFGVVAGSDKQISIYLDGVYISSPRGSIFDLPDIQRIEVLRGPQGTLFGRNATGGAVSVTTRDPTGEPHVKAEASVGNYDHYRVRMTAETPAMGPLSAYFSFVRNYRRGDIGNANAGVIWDRSLAGPPFGRKPSAKWLGTVDSNSYFAAVKLEPSDDFKLVYKYDRNEDDGTPEGTAFVAFNPDAPLVGAIANALFTSQPIPVLAATDALRPKVVNNGWVTDRDMKIEGHSATATWQATDNISVKNIFAYRKVYVHAPSAIDGLSDLTFTPQALAPIATYYAFADPANQNLTIPQRVALIPGIAGQLVPFLGQRIVWIGSQATSTAKQWSDELQLNYTSDDLQVTLGALWFHSKDASGGPGGADGMQNTFAFLQTRTFLPSNFVPTSGLLPLGNVGFFENKATSLAAYAQVEYKITPQLELVAGARITRDKKTHTFTFNSRTATGISPNIVLDPPDYKKTKPNWLIGLNYTPNDDMLFYGKFSTSFVSGGTTAGIEYEPETVRSFEVGIKADLLDNRLRANLALFHAKYKHFQSPQGTSQASSFEIVRIRGTELYGPEIGNLLPPVLSTFVIDQGDIRAQGFELEVTAAPVDGLTLGGGLGYTDVKFTFINPIVLETNNNELAITNRPKWTGTLWGAYETPPLTDEMTLMFRADANFRSKQLLDPQQNRTTPSLLVLRSVPAYWVINGRIALRHIKLGGVEAELAAWGKNLTNERYASFALVQDIASSANFIAPRTYGLDFSIEF